MNSYKVSLYDHCENQKEALPSGLSLDPHQQEAMQEACTALKGGATEFSIVHSCGSGKTILEANLIMASQRAKVMAGIGEPRKDLIVTTERSLIHGIRMELKQLGLEIGTWGAGKRELDYPVILAGIQALQMNRRELDHLLPADGVDLLIGDEADSYLTGKRRSIIERYRNAIKIGLTATPTWPDGRDISDIWGKKIHQMNLRDAILREVNVPPLFYLFEANLDDSALTFSQGDYEQKVLASALREAEIHKAISEVYERLIPRDQRKQFPTLMYLPSISLVRDGVELLKERFSEEGVTVKGWTGEDIGNREMEEDIEAFNNGRLDILLLCEMGGRGINLPRARCLIDAYPTLSPTKLEQRHGRVLRKIREGSQLDASQFQKSFALIAQIVPRSNRFRPYLLPDLLDCWDDFREGRVLMTKEKRGDQIEVSEQVGRPLRDEVDKLRKYIEQQRPSHYVSMVRKIDVYEQLKLSDELPQADETGFFTKTITDEDGKKTEIKFGTIRAWKRELYLSMDVIKRRLEGKTGIFGKDSGGRIYDFFSESVVRQACADVLEELPQADETGFFTKTITDEDGKKTEIKFGTINAWEREFVLSRDTIKKRLERKTGISGKDSGGSIRDFFSESEVRQACADALEELPQADERGFFMKIITDEDGIKREIRFGTVSAWVRELYLSMDAIKKRLEGKTGISGKDSRSRNICDFFSESVVRHACADLLEELPRADKTGFFTKTIIDEDKREKEVRFGTIQAWRRAVKISRLNIKKRLEGKTGISGKHSGGRICDFFSELVVRQALADLIQKKGM